MRGGCGGGKSGLPNGKGGSGRIPSNPVSTSAAARTGASRRSVRVARPRASQQQQHRSMGPVHMSEFAVLGLSPLASRNDVKHAYKRLALKYHPDVVAARSTNGGAAIAEDREDAFREIKSAYESLMLKFEEEMGMASSSGAAAAAAGCGSYGGGGGDEWDEWDDWMGFEGGVPVVYHPAS